MQDCCQLIATDDRDTETDDREVRLENCESIINGAESGVTTHPNYIERKSHVSERRSAHIYIYNIYDVCTCTCLASSG